MEYGMEPTTAFRPAHYVLTINKVSKLVDLLPLPYSWLKCHEFEAWGYTWIFGFMFKHADHVSFSVELVGDIPAGLVVSSRIKFFMYHYVNQQYAVFPVGVQTFGSMDQEGYCHDFLSEEEFFHGPNFLVDDRCVIGVEICPVRINNTVTLKSLIDLPSANQYYLFSITNFPNKRSVLFTPMFRIGHYSWYLAIHPFGCQDAYGRSLSIFLHLSDPSAVADGNKIYAHFVIQILNQKSRDHLTRPGYVCFSENNLKWGIDDFIALDQLEQGNELVVADEVKFRVEFKSMFGFTP